MNNILYNMITHIINKIKEDILLIKLVLTYDVESKINYVYDSGYIEVIIWNDAVRITTYYVSYRIARRQRNISCIECYSGRYSTYYYLDLN